MLMHHAMHEVAKEEGNLFWKSGDRITTESFKPLSKRVGKSLLEGMKNLKTVLLASDFESYIETIVSLKIINGSLWLITDSPLHRSLLEHRFVPAFKEAFEVEDVRIISQI